MADKICSFLRIGEKVIQVETWGTEKAALTVFEGRYYFYLAVNNAVEIREVDYDKVFDLTRIADWVKVTMRLSNKKRRMRVPTQCVMRAVGFQLEDVDLFLNNETKTGLSAKLRQTEWFRNAHHEIQTAVLKLFAHLGLFEQQDINKRMKIIEQVIDNFTLLEIHNLFGGLRPGTSLKRILAEQDLEQEVDAEIRKRFDPIGKKAINFFLENMANPRFKKIACYALTHYVPEMALYDSQKKTANATLESQCAVCGIEAISTIANLINLKHEEIAEVLYRRYANRDSVEENITKLQDEMEALRSGLHEVVERDGNALLKLMLGEVRLSRKPFTIEYMEKHYEEVHFSDRVVPEIAKSAVMAGYKTCDEREVAKLSDLYSVAKEAPAKCFDMSLADSVLAGYTYKWLAADNPDLYTVAMLCGNTCMRPGFAGEAALWESALSDDVAIGIVMDDDKIVAYYRVNYDKENRGIYIDTVESRFSKVLNSEEVWATVRRAVIEMAQRMNDIGSFPVDVTNFREERGNRLKQQWDRLPIADKILQGRVYHHPNAPWSYGDNESRIQKEVWKK